jgi:hypothetical protein
MKFPARKLLLRSTIALLSATAILGVISVLWPGLGEAGSRLLASTAAADAASILALCCTGAAVSGPHRAVQVTGIASACSGLAASLYLIWSSSVAGGSPEAILRAAAVLWILATASAHVALMLGTLGWRRRGRPARILVAGTVLCTAAAAELIANYALFPGFEPGNGYGRALAVILILDVLGTILIMLMHRFGQPHPGAMPPAPAPDPLAPEGTSGPARLQAVGCEVRSKT